MALDVRSKRIYDPLDQRRRLPDPDRPHFGRAGFRLPGPLAAIVSKLGAQQDELRRWFDHRPARFAVFRTRYRDELTTHADRVGELRP